MERENYLATQWTQLRVPPTRSGAEVVSYSPCPHCGFQLAEVHLQALRPGGRSQIECPICGLRSSDNGADDGVALSEAERADRLTRWLHDHGYDPERVYKRWGFRVADFFAKGSV
jgi:hypothetical protein